MMFAIEEKDVSIDKIFEIFKPWNLPIEIKKFAPAVAAWNLLEEAEFYMDVPIGFFETDEDDESLTNYTWTRKLIISLDWTGGTNGNTPAMRIIMSVMIISETEINKSSKNKGFEAYLFDLINTFNAPSLNFGGALVYNSGVKLISFINYKDGVLSQNIISVAKDLLIGSKSLRQSFYNLRHKYLDI